VVYGWAPKGERCHALKPGRASARLTAIAAQAAGRTIAPFVFEGSTNRAVFEAWLEGFLVPELREGSTLVLDNASFHRYSDIESIAEKAGHKVLWLPAYSPDLNPIERYWAKLKKAHRNICTRCGWLEGRSVDLAFKLCPHLSF